jgi:hypothetical protein
MPRRALIAAALAAALVLGAKGHAAFPGSGRYAGASAGAYVGPLDAVNSGAPLTNVSGAWCLRKCYNGFTTGSTILELERSSDSTTLNLGALATGAMDTSGVAAFCGSANANGCYWLNWYDQSGNGCTLANQTPSQVLPLLALASTPHSQASGNFGASSTSAYMKATCGEPSQPFTIAAYQQLAWSSGYPTPFGWGVTSQPSASPGAYLFHDNAANLFTGYVGSSGVTYATASDGSFHAFMSTFNGSSSVNVVDGTSTASATQTGNITTATVILGALNNDAPQTNFSEYILWSADMSAKASALAANETGYY